MVLDYYNPTRILSGAGVLKNFDGWSDLGTKAFIVCGGTSAQKCGALQDAEAGLQAAGVAYRIFNKIGPNPLIDVCYAGGKEAAAFGADFVLGIGGGSPLDAAKAIAVYAANPQLPMEDILKGGPRADALPMVAVGTTAGTGSEVTPVSVLTVPSLETKKSFRGDDIYPRYAFLDPTYTATLSPLQTWATAADAVCHAVEGYFMKKATLVSDALAEKCLPMLTEGMRRVAAGNTDFETRTLLLYGSTLAGGVIARTGTGFVHSAGYPLTYRHGLCHGWANSYFIGDFLAFMHRENPERGARILACMGFESCEAFGDFIASCPHMPLKPVLTREQAEAYALAVSKVKNVTAAVSAISPEELTDIFVRRCV